MCQLQRCMELQWQQLLAWSCQHGVGGMSHAQHEDQPIVQGMLSLQSELTKHVRVAP